MLSTSFSLKFKMIFVLFLPTCMDMTRRLPQKQSRPMASCKVSFAFMQPTLFWAIMNDRRSSPPFPRSERASSLRASSCTTAENAKNMMRCLMRLRHLRSSPNNRHTPPHHIGRGSFCWNLLCSTLILGCATLFVEASTMLLLFFVACSLRPSSTTPSPDAMSQSRSCLEQISAREVRSRTAELCAQQESRTHTPECDLDRSPVTFAQDSAMSALSARAIQRRDATVLFATLVLCDSSPSDGPPGL